MLWVAVRLPYLQIDTLKQTRGDDPQNSGPSPTTVAAIYNSTKRIVQTCQHAADLGIAEGMSIATARALCESIQLLPERIEAPLDALRSLQLFSYRLSPHSAIEQPDMLFIEVSSTLKVFDGLDTILRVLHDELGNRQWRYQLAIGLTQRSAALFTHSTPPPFLDPLTIPSKAEQQTVLDRIAVQQLQCSSKAIVALSKIGIEYCYQINALSADDRKRTLSDSFNDYWRSLMPASDQTRPLFKPPSQFEERVEFLNTIISAKGLLFVCNRLAQNLSQYLIAIQGHTCSLSWLLHDIKGKTLQIDIATAQPLQQPLPIIELTALKLESIKLKQPIEALSLHCDQIVFEQKNQQDLFTRNDQHKPAHLLNLLAARLHEQQFFSLGLQSQHQPELAQTAVKAGTAVEAGTAIEAGTEQAQVTPPRPTFLLHNPPPLKVVDKQLYWRSKIELIKGPERIETGWWFIAINRDYYIAQDQEHRLLWVFYDRLKNSWFLAGVFS